MCLLCVLSVYILEVLHATKKLYDITVFQLIVQRFEKFGIFSVQNHQTYKYWKKKQTECSM